MVTTKRCAHCMPLLAAASLAVEDDVCTQLSSLDAANRVASVQYLVQMNPSPIRNSSIEDILTLTCRAGGVQPTRRSESTRLKPSAQEIRDRLKEN
jgi:hypothetical protein